MEIGLGIDGSFDCSGLVIYALSKMVSQPIEAWPRDLRHTRQMVAALEVAGEKPKAIHEADQDDIGNLVFTRMHAYSGWRTIHVGVLTGFNNNNIIRLESAGPLGRVVERPMPECEPGKRMERFLLRSSRLAELALTDVAAPSSLEF